MANSELTVRQACEDDLPELLELYGEVSAAMRSTPYDIDWDLSWHPTRESLTEHIVYGDMFVAELAHGGAASQLAGAFALNTNQAPGYERVAWQVDAAPEQAGVIHLVAVSPTARGRGVARTLLTAAERVARERDYRCIRLDAYPNNAPAIALYGKCGYANLGTYEIDYEGCDNDTFVMMERVL